MYWTWLGSAFKGEAGCFYISWKETLYHFTYFMLPKSVCILLKINVHYYFYHFTIHSVDYLITHTNTCTYIYIYIYNLRSLKFTLKHLKCSYMFRSHDHPQGAYIAHCWSYNLKHSVYYFMFTVAACRVFVCESYAV